MTKNHADKWPEFVAGTLKLRDGARITGLSQQVISHIRSGRYVPTPETVLAMANGFGVSRATVARDVATLVRRTISQMIAIAGD